jgi:histone H3/H4
MAKISSSAIEQLKSSLSASSVIVTPDSADYANSIKRWFASAEKPAVCPLPLRLQ